MASEIRVNSLTNRSGLSTVTIADTGAVVAGIVTATTFSGPLTGAVTGNVTGNLTGNVTGNLTGNVTGTATTATALSGSPSITVTDITATGNVSIGGTLTYEDVTNIDSVGIITAQSDVLVGRNLSVTSGISTVKSLDYAAIDSTISDTAVDVFIYDTSKDSDGGAWRKRTQHTSWYNETLNTSTRGSRREFPSVAVIVAYSEIESGSDDMVVIYDGDDPDLPMWMVFKDAASEDPFLDQSTPGSSFIGNYYPTSVSALNGIVCLGTYRQAGALSGLSSGLRKFSFIEDACYATNNSNTYKLGTTFVDRNTTTVSQNAQGGAIVDVNAQDVAMTVLPNAPIDDTTGLPIPTIAVGTDGGASIIKDDGNVFDITITTGANNDADRVDFTDDNRVVIQWGGDSAGEITIDEIPSSDTSANYPINLPGSHYNDNSPGSYSPIFLTEGPSTTNRHPTAIAQFRAVGTTAALSLFDENKTSEEDGMVAYATTSYNTGWMQGDIKGAFLSDTDTTNVSADTLNSVNTFDGTFATSTGWTTDSDWTISGGVATCNGNNSGKFIYPTNDRWSYGRSVVVEITVTAYTSGTLTISYSTGAATSGTNMTATGTYKFVNVTTGNELIYIRSESFIGSIDNVKIYYTEEDRSVNNNGLIPYGTVTKSAVATGADLVAYSGFTDNDYLTQPYNSDLDFGTGDYYMSIWAKGGGSAQCLMIREHGTYDDDGAILLFQYNGKYAFYSRQDGTGAWTTFLATNATYGNYWSHVVMVRSGGTLYGYVNGKLEGSTSFTGDVSNNDAKIYIGRRNPAVDNSQEYSGSLALARIGGSAPSPEQIKKMYEDEKVLFQENAKATLYGSSDAVTALAYDDDTDLLHVGTSSGRSDFQGLRRINNTTTAVTTAITAQNEFIIEQ